VLKELLIYLVNMCQPDTSCEPSKCTLKIDVFLVIQLYFVGIGRKSVLFKVRLSVLISYLQKTIYLL
jgi:hypothetical protein